MGELLDWLDQLNEDNKRNMQALLSRVDFSGGEIMPVMKRFALGYIKSISYWKEREGSIIDKKKMKDFIEKDKYIAFLFRDLTSKGIAENQAYVILNNIISDDRNLKIAYDEL